MAGGIDQGVSEGAGEAERQATAAGAAASARAKPKRGGDAKKRTSAASTVAKRPKATKSSTKKSKPAVEETAADDESQPLSRKELLEKALRAVAKDLNAAGEQRPTNTIGNLVQLLKLDRSFREDEEQPHEIRVVWEEKREETIDDSPERSGEASRKT